MKNRKLEERMQETQTREWIQDAGVGFLASQMFDEEWKLSSHSFDKNDAFPKMVVF